MITLRVGLLAGRYHATPWGHQVNEGAVEWPPAPWRLLRALVAAWKQTAPDAGSAQVSSLLRRLAEPPEFRLPPAAVSHLRHYMPAPQKTTKIFDTFVAIDPNESMWVTWPGVELDASELALLTRIVEAVPFLGRAESWCDVAVSNEREARGHLCRPVHDGETGGEVEYVRLLCAEPWSDQDMVEPGHPLMVDTTHLREVKRRLDPPGSAWVLYERPIEALNPEPKPRSRPSRTLNAARYYLDGAALPSVRDTIRIAALVRERALGISPGSWILSGKENGKPVRRDHKHAFYLPTDEDGDGRIDHVIVFTREGFRVGDEVHRALSRINLLAGTKDRPELRAFLLGMSDSPVGGEGGGLGKLFRTTRCWRSVTPYVPSRHPRGDLLAQIRLDAQRMGFMSRVDVAAYRRKPSVRHPAWTAFRRWRRGKPGPVVGGAWGLRLRFAEPVQGPVALGYGSHFGLGLFEPDDDDDRGEGRRGAATISL